MCKPGSNLVRFDRGLMLESIAKAPSEFTLHARNPERNLTFGGNHINFGTVASAPNVSDLDRGRRPGNFEDYCNLLRLCQSLNIVQFIGGYPVEPADLPPATRHLDAHYAAITLTDRVWHPYSLGKQRITDAIEMISIARGFISDEQLRAGAQYLLDRQLEFAAPPRRADAAGPAGDGAPRPAGGADALHALAAPWRRRRSPARWRSRMPRRSAGITLIQIVAPGVPCMYGGFTSNVDMKTGAPAFGTPEYTRAALAGGQLARKYKHALPLLKRLRRQCRRCPGGL